LGLTKTGIFLQGYLDRLNQLEMLQQIGRFVRRKDTDSAGANAWSHPQPFQIAKSAATFCCAISRLNVGRTLGG
jgi:hypothetical protein